MTQSTTRVRPGFEIADTGYQTEAEAYLKARLLVFYGIAVFASVGLLLVINIMEIAIGQWTWAGFTDAPSLVHTGSCILAVVFFLILRSRPFGGSTLR